MSVPVQYTSRRRRLAQSLESAILLTLVFGVVGVGINLPPLPPPGVNPSDGNGSKKCPAARAGWALRLPELRCGV